MALLYCDHLPLLLFYRILLDHIKVYHRENVSVFILHCVVGHTNNMPLMYTHARTYARAHTHTTHTHSQAHMRTHTRTHTDTHRQTRVLGRADAKL